MSDSLQRLHPAARYSEATIHGSTVYLAGQVCANGATTIEGQTEDVLAQIDRLLAEAGSDKTRILRAEIFLADMGDYAGMNSVWDRWVPAGAAPARATVQARLAKPDWKVEIIVTAARG
jgi:enamine deaminase RidA (YjgF/YER057c/UK114 family)